MPRFKEQEITWLDTRWTVSLSSYTNNARPALILTDADTWQPGPVVTVNLPNEDIPKDHVAIRDYSETVGILDVLIEAGIVEEPVRHAKSGFVTIPICKLADPNAPANVLD
jgi:hypothetical protein